MHHDILITGATGVLGQNLVPLLATQHQTTSIHGLLLPEEAVPDSFQSLPNLTIHHGFFGEVELPFTGGVVIHLAGARNGGTDQLSEVNVIQTEQLARRAAEANADFIFASTQAVYGSANTLPATEDQIPQPDLAYARSKLQAEQAIASVYASGGGRWVALRMARLYGATPVPRYEGVLGDFLEAALTSRIAQIHGQGSSLLSIMHVSEAARAIYVACEYAPELEGPYNVGPPAPVTVLELAAAIASLVPGFQWELVPDLFEPRGMMLDSTRFQEATGWQPQITLQQGLEEALRVLRATQ
jgi:UDP-glucose 4-epimerase